MLIDNVKKFVYPSRCVICDSILPYGDKLQNEFLCDECRKYIEFIKEPICKKCGAMIQDENEMYCTRCKTKMYDSFEYGFGLCRYNNAIKESLHRIKYNGRKEYIEFYGKCIAKVHYNKIKNICPDFLVPVPIHKKRLNERNYNQASVLAYSISDELKNFGIDLEVNENLIFRKKNTKVLNKLDNKSRSNELNDAFTIKNVDGISNVLIVDDIYTTGSTIDNIAKLLKNNGLQKIYFVTIAVVDNL